MGTIKIGSANNRKGITVNPLEVFFNGSVVKSIMSGLTVIWDSSKPLVPIMTSNTSSGGEVSASSIMNANYPEWHAFDNDDSTGWVSNQVSPYIQYKFVNPTRVKYFELLAMPDRDFTFTLQASSNNVDFVNLTTDITQTVHGQRVKVSVNNNNYYTTYRLQCNKNDTNQPAIMELQFYGSQVFALVPTLSSNVGINGEVIASGVHPSYVGAEYRAFDGDSNSMVCDADSTSESFFGYKFASPVCVKLFSIIFKEDNRVASSFAIEASNDNSDWVTLATISNNSQLNVSGGIDNNNTYLYYRYKKISGSSEWYNTAYITELQFYGDEKYQVKGLVPTMTSNTAPYGEAFGDGTYQWYVFSGTGTAQWNTASATNQHIGYKFVSPARVTSVSIDEFVGGGYHSAKDFKIQASNDGSTWDDIYSDTLPEKTSRSVSAYRFSNSKYYLYWRVLILNTYNGNVSLYSLQFYGEQLEALVPTMTNYSKDGYIVIYSDEAKVTPNNWYAWKVFDNDTTKDTSTKVQCWVGSTPINSYVGIHLPSKKAVKFFTIENYDYSDSDVQAIKEFVLQGSNDGEQWNDIQSYTNSSNVRKNISYYNVDSPVVCYQYRILIKSVHQTYGIIRELQFYA